MELTAEQYQLLRMPIERYKFSIAQGFRVWNDEDMKKAMKVRKELGITEPLPDCGTCKEQQYAKAIFAQLAILFDNYGAN